MPYQNMKRYQCHKIVSASKVVDWSRAPDSSEAHLALESGDNVIIAASRLPKGGGGIPIVGGYFVAYDDGYESFSPAKPFEDGYTLLSDSSDAEIIESDVIGVRGLNFGSALMHLRAGRRVSRAGWNGRGMWLILVDGTPKAALKAGSPYQMSTGLSECEILPHIDMWTVNADGRRAMLPGWLASQSDMLANDWEVVA